MSLDLPAEAYSICWACRYWGWATAFTGNESEWENVCNNPAEYVANDEKSDCAGYESDRK